MAEPRDSRRAHVVGAGLVLVAAVALCVRSWRAWADVFVDFGRELYLPWRIGQGDVLYRDLAAFNGPLSAYWNALWMAAFDGYTGIIASNLVLLAALLALLARLLSRIARPFAVWAALLFFVVVFAFGQSSGVGNYSFASPYAHEATHGFLLAVAALTVAHGGTRLTRPRLALVGALLGLAFLTKLELFLAGTGATAVGLWLRARDEGRRPLADLALVAATGLVPVVVALSLLATAMPVQEALAGLTASWRGALGPASRLPFYRGDLGAGVDRPLHNLLVLASWAGGFAGIALLAALVERVFPRPGWRAPIACFLATLWGLYLLPVAAGDVGRPLPLLVAVFAVQGLLTRARASDPGERARLAARVGVLVFALLALAKMFLAAKLWHYGFVLASPAVMLCVLYGTSWFPAACVRRGTSGRMATAVFLGLFAWIGWGYAHLSEVAYSERTIPVGEGHDRIVANVRGSYAVRALTAIEERLEDGDTLLVLPEGISLNYLSRHGAPTKYINFMPPEFALYGEDAMLAALQARPPDAVLLVHKDTTEYGLPLFGEHYGERLLAWVREGYGQVWSHGDEPLTPDARFGVALLLPRADGR